MIVELYDCTSLLEYRFLPDVFYIVKNPHTDQNFFFRRKYRVLFYFLHTTALSEKVFSLQKQDFLFLEFDSIFPRETVQQISVGSQ